MKKILGALLLISLMLTIVCASAEDKGYLSTYDVASAGEVSRDVMSTSLGDSDGGPYLRGVMQAYMEYVSKRDS